jgi:hypothetical protein
MTPGIYRAEWGRNGLTLGGGVVTFMHNTIAGADLNNCIFKGEYAFDGGRNEGPSFSS